MVKNRVIGGLKFLLEVESFQGPYLCIFNADAFMFGKLLMVF